MGAELEKGRNLLAETSGGQIRKGPKPLATTWVNITVFLLWLLAAEDDSKDGNIFSFLNSLLKVYL